MKGGSEIVSADFDQTSVVYALWHTKKMCWRELSLAGHNVNVRGGLTKTV